MLPHRNTAASRVTIRPGHSRDRLPSLVLILAMATFWVTVLGLDAFVRFWNHVYVVANVAR